MRTEISTLGVRKLASTLLAASVIVSSLLADSSIEASKVSSNLDKVNCKSDVWSDAEFSKVTLYPQTTIKFNDKKANALNAGNKAIVAQIAAVYNSSKIAFMIKWPDGTQSIQQSDKTDTYSDGFAIQFASNYSNPKKLPYIGMGSEGRAVVVHLQKEAGRTFEPNGNGNVAYQVNPNQTDLFDKDLEKYNDQVKTLGSRDYERIFVSEGFRSMSEIKDGSSKSFARIAYTGEGWKGSLVRPLKDEYLNLNSAVIPVAFAVWDGDKLGRNGLKYLSAWTAVELEGKPGSDALFAVLYSDVRGDAVKGKDAAIANCSACHQLSSHDATNLMGPSLTNIGGYSTIDYLKESLVDPSAVVVPGYNRNAHSNYAWYNIENGKRVSSMPGFDWMSAQEIEDIVAYLKTLKVEAK